MGEVARLITDLPLTKVNYPLPDAVEARKDKDGKVYLWDGKKHAWSGTRLDGIEAALTNMGYEPWVLAMRAANGTPA